MRPNFFHHLHPPSIPAEQARLRFTLGAGGLSVFLILVVAFSGMLEVFYYIPTPEQAPISIQSLTFLTPFGGFVRNLHYWSSQLLVLAAGLHLLRVIFTGAYAPPRRFNYLLGLGLFVLILLLDFTGYVLRWDEDVRWALVTGTNLLKTIPVVGQPLYGLVVGGDKPGPGTLVRFYGWHMFGLMLIAVIVGVWHLFRVRRDGGIAAPPPALRSDSARITRFELARREGLAALLAGTALVLLATFFPAPLAQPIGEMIVSNGIARAPWFFLWVQYMLRWGDPFLFGVLIPLGALTLLALLPYLTPAPRPAELGRWFPPSGRAAQVIAGLITLAVLTLSLLAWLTPA
ncbi:MAG: cytochrome b N-terminal domain-containing protein [Anaerolineales bacterium]|nr:cytochrome b N-terminal domain-containing protein [Anaerolineales bacterium]